jgi:hypothetical protein
MTAALPVTEPPLLFVTAASDPAVLAQRLLASPCLRPRGGWPLIVRFNASSAAQALDLALAAAPPGAWVVWVHQDVHLPAPWAAQFLAGLAAARAADPELAVAGVYGVAGHGAALRRAGAVLDRGTPLRESAALPCAVDSLDELLVAVRADAGLRFDPALRFDLYGTDIVLQAQARGLGAAVVDAWCEHWSDTPRGGLPPALVERIAASGRVFDAKWAQRLPVATSWLEIGAPGDIERFVRAHIAPAPGTAPGPAAAPAPPGDGAGTVP